MTVSAPGKLFLAGEYAVLHGGTAVIAAVDRRAVARFVPGGSPATPLIAEAVKAVQEERELRGLAVLEGAPDVDSSALIESGQKLGLGSSAAAVVAAVGALLEVEGRSLDEARSLVLVLALRAHRAAQGGRGSGGDVAAAVFGGVITYARPGGEKPALRPLRSALPAELVVFRAGAPVATVDHLRAVGHLAERDPKTHDRCLREIADAADEFIVAYESGDAEALVNAVDRSHLALDALGRAAELQIVTPRLALASTLARELGGAAKPSGAGGGDVGVAFFSDPTSAESFRGRAVDLGLPIVSITTGARGLGREN